MPLIGHPPVLPFPPLSPKGAFYIYVLIDKRDGLVRYVGQTRYPKSRLEDHLLPETGNRHLQNWKREGGQLDLVKIGRCMSRSEAWNLETEWIDAYRKAGNIYNVLRGGRFFYKNNYVTKKKKKRRF